MKMGLVLWQTTNNLKGSKLMSTPYVSVIVPVYNAEKFINECVNSILGQTMSDLELILVDDGSPDNCGAICDEYAIKDSRVRVFHQKNGGVCAARNKGLSMATGEYVSFVDSDDYLEPDAIELLCNDIITYNADISCALMVGDSNQGVSNLKNGIYEVWSGSDAIKESLLDNRFTYSSCARLYKKSFLGDIRFEEGRKIHEDSFFNFSVFLRKPTVVVRNIGVYNYVKNSESASHAEFSEKFFDILYFADRKKELANEFFPEFQAEINNTIVKANLAMLHAFCNTNDKKYKKDIKRCIKTVKELKSYFVPAIPGDRKFFNVVTNNLYGIFKIYYNLRYKRK